VQWHDLPKETRNDAVVFGEISGNYSGPIEQCYIIIIHISLKLSYIYPDKFKKIYQNLQTVRFAFWLDAIKLPNKGFQTKEVLRNLVFISNHLADALLWSKVTLRKEKTIQSRVSWSRGFYIFWEILNKLQIWNRHKYDKEKDLMASIQPVLDLASVKMPTYEELINAMGGGEGATCASCEEGVTLDGLEIDFTPSTDIASTIGGPNGWIFLSHEGFKTVCDDCKDYMIHEEYIEAQRALCFMQNLALFCSNCGKNCRGRPRCKDCQSKVYCNEDCLAEDAQLHQLFCQGIQDAAAEGELGRRISKREADRRGEEMTSAEFRAAEEKRVAAISAGVQKLVEPPVDTWTWRDPERGIGFIIKETH